MDGREKDEPRHPKFRATPDKFFGRFVAVEAGLQKRQLDEGSGNVADLFYGKGNVAARRGDDLTKADPAVAVKHFHGVAHVDADDMEGVVGFFTTQYDLSLQRSFGGHMETVYVGHRWPFSRGRYDPHDINKTAPIARWGPETLGRTFVRRPVKAPTWAAPRSALHWAEAGSPSVVRVFDPGGGPEPGEGLYPWFVLPGDAACRIALR